MENGLWFVMTGWVLATGGWGPEGVQGGARVQACWRGTGQLGEGVQELVCVCMCARV